MSDRPAPAAATPQLELPTYRIGQRVRVRIRDGSNWVGTLIERRSDGVIIEPENEPGRRIYRQEADLFDF